MVKTSRIDTDAAMAPLVHSMWSILQRGYSINPNLTALTSPTQPARHLELLVGRSRTSLRVYATGSPKLFFRRFSAWFACFLSGLVLPAGSSNADLCLRWSFAQLRRGATRLGFFLENCGISQQSSALIIVPNCAEWALMLWVSAMKRYPLATLLTAMLEPGHELELEHYLAALKPSIVMVRNQNDAIAIDQARSKYFSDTPFVGITLEPLLEPQQDWISMETISTSFFPDHIEVTPPPPDDINRTAMIVFTSGTSTGRPKACVRTVRDLLRPLAAAPELKPLRAPVVLINAAISGSLAPCLLYSAWHSGNAGALAGPGSFTPSMALSSMNASRPVAAALFPYMVDILRRQGHMSPSMVESLRFLFIIGSVITVETLCKAQRMFPKAKILANYSSTEAPGMFDWPKGPPAAKNVPSYKGIVACGITSPGVKVKIVDDTGRIVERGQHGMLHLCGDMLASGYLGGEGAGVFYQDGNDRWYITGDCGLLDDQDHMYVLGRYDSMVRRDATMISPATVENVIQKHLPNNAVVVVDVQESNGTSQMYAVLHDAVGNSQEIENIITRELGSAYYLDGIVDLTQLGLTGWPCTIVGKLSVIDLRSLVVKYFS